MKRLTLSILAVLFSGIAFAASSTEESAQRLISAVRFKNKNRVKELLTSNKVDVNALYNGQTALDVAVDCRCTKIAKVLMDSGAKVTTIENAKALRRMFKKRAVNFFVAGFFFTPWLWIGSFCALSDMPYAEAMVLAK